MAEAWPAVCTVAALAVLLVLIIRFQLHAFAALLVVSLALGLATAMRPVDVVTAIGQGVGDILRGVAIILALGAMLGKILDASGAAEVIARTLVRAFGVRQASLAILFAAYLIGIPILFNVGFLLLIPIMARLQAETGKSFLYYVLPMSFSLGITHSLIPPHPGIVSAVGQLSGSENAGRVMVETILFGTLMGIPMVLVGWLGPGRYWASRQFATVPEFLITNARNSERDVSPPSFLVSVFIVVLPLVLSMVGFGADLLDRVKAMPEWMTQPLASTEVIAGWPPLTIYPVRDWLLFLGKAEMALLVPTGLAFVLLGVRRGMPAQRLAKLATDSLTEIGGILLLFAAAGGFMQVIKDSGAGQYIAKTVLDLDFSRVMVFYLVAVVSRIALGSATAAIVTASSLLAETARSLPGEQTLLVLAVANGVTFMTQPADSGFWMVKEYCNLSVRDVMVRFNACRILMSLTGLGLLLAYEAYFQR
jgi:gluconate transporter